MKEGCNPYLIGKCPKCGNELDMSDFGNGELHICNYCGYTKAV